MKTIIATLILAIGALALEPQEIEKKPPQQGRRDGDPDGPNGPANCYACHSWIP